MLTPTMVHLPVTSLGIMTGRTMLGNLTKSAWEATTKRIYHHTAQNGLVVSECIMFFYLINIKGRLLLAESVSD